MVQSGDMSGMNGMQSGGWDEHGFEVDALHDGQGERVVAEQDMHTQETKNAEVTKVSVEGFAGELAVAGGGGGVCCCADAGQGVMNVRLLDERVEDIQNGVAAPNLRRLFKQLNFVWRLVLGFRAPCERSCESVWRHASSLTFRKSCSQVAKALNCQMNSSMMSQSH